ncbi:large ribosomal subunit protein bL20m-like [Ptychodera flava]|uniref:large ribosomal subunit protein bL20m-like n=1 Tax=Ptychodera flava TaxID=63121 RepID=UPI00396A725E
MHVEIVSSVVYYRKWNCKTLVDFNKLISMFLTHYLMARCPPPDRWARKQKIFALSKYFGYRRRNCYSLAVRTVHKALQYSTLARIKKKRHMRTLWIMRLSAATREHGMKYHHFMQNLTKCNIQLDRKVLSHLAVYEPKTFKSLVEVARSRQQEGLLAALAPQQKVEGVFSKVTEKYGL